MKTIVERFLVIWELERLDAKWLEEMTGIKEKRFYTIRARLDMRSTEIEKIQNVFPEYKVWLATGDEYPEAGQISPMTKRAHTSLKTGPQAG